MLSSARVARRVQRAACVALLLASACVPAVPRASSTVPVPAASSQWLIEPGDVVRLHNWGAPEQSGDLLVNDRGVVLIPTVGRLVVGGTVPDSLEQRVIRAFAGRFDPSRVEAMLLRPIAVTGGVKTASVLLADPTSSVQTLIARAGGSVRAGGDYRVYLLRPGLPAREVSTADRISDLGVRSSDQLYLQDPPFVVRNEVSIRSIFEALQLTIGALTVYYLIRRG